MTRFASLIPAGAPVLDLACGRGRHTRFLLARGHDVIAVDRDTTALDDIRGDARLTVIDADLETGGELPFLQRRFGGVVVTNYLHRPILAALVAAVEAGGAFIYETFAEGNERFGRPSNPDYLLRPGELLDVVQGALRVVAYEDLEVDQPRPAAVQRIAAINFAGSRSTAQP